MISSFASSTIVKISSEINDGRSMMWRLEGTKQGCFASLENNDGDYLTMDNNWMGTVVPHYSEAHRLACPLRLAHIKPFAPNTAPCASTTLLLACFILFWPKHARYIL